MPILTRKKSADRSASVLVWLFSTLVALAVMTSAALAQQPAAPGSQPGTAQPGAAQPAPGAKPAASGSPAAATPAQPAQPDQPVVDDPGLETAKPAADAAAATTQPAEDKKVEVKPFEVDPVDEKLKRQRTDVVKNLRDSRFENSAQQQAFEEYYNKYALPRWTQKDTQTALAEYRKDLRVELQTGKGGGPPHDRLLQLALAYLTKLAKGHYPPAVRYNATLALGDLFAREAQDIRTPPIPLPAAQPVLLELVNSGEESVIDAVRVAALVALNRHAILGISDQQVVSQQVIPSMLKLATTKVAPGRSAEGHAWMRALACDTLGELQSPGQQGEVAAALAEIAGDSSAHFVARSAAARALGKLNYQGLNNQGAAVTVTQLASQVGKLAADALQEEADRKMPNFEQLLAEKKGSSGMGMMPGMDGMMMDPSMMDSMMMGGMPSAAPKEEDERKELEKEYSRMLRRRLMDRVAAAIMGVSGGLDERFKGIASAATEPQQKDYVGAVVQRLDAVKNLCGDGEMPYEQLVSRIQEEARQMRAVVEKPAAAENAGAAAATPTT